MAFNPNKNALGVCLERIKAAKTRFKIPDDQIFTSKDYDIWGDPDSVVTNIPGGFHKVLLPFSTDGPATFYISSAGPNTTVPRHSHDEGAGIRFIVSGSIIYKGAVLGQGDWMYLPAKAPYEFVVGPMGVTIFYCYQCCCA